MRTIKHFTSFILCVVTFAGLSSMNVDNAYCAERSLYIGEYCWETDGSAFVRLGFTLMGDGHFTFCGIAEQPGIEWAVNGNLEVIDDSAVMTITGASVFDGGMAMGSHVSHVILDISTLNGTSNNMDMNWEDGVCSLDHTSSILYSVSCDKSVSPDGVDKREELIRLLKKYSTAPEEQVD